MRIDPTPEARARMLLMHEIATESGDPLSAADIDGLCSKLLGG